MKKHYSKNNNFCYIPKINERGFLYHIDKMHFSLSIHPIFLRKLLVESRRCRNLKLKTMNFELLVHVKIKT